MSKLEARMPSKSLSDAAASAGKPVVLDGMDVVVHEVVPLMPATLKPRKDEGDVVPRPRARR